MDQHSIDAPTEPDDRVGAQATEFDERPRQLLGALQQAVRDTPAEAILLSGGIDSSMLAALAPPKSRVAVTVVLKGCESNLKPDPQAGCGFCAGNPVYPPGCGADLEYARQVAQHLNMNERWHPVIISQDQALAHLEDLVYLTQSYDLGLLNDIPIYVGLKSAASLNLKMIWTGEDADTLFAGYKKHQQERNWRNYMRRAIPKIRPPSLRIGKKIDMDMQYPYLHPKVLEVARSLRKSDVIGYRKSERAGAFVDQFDAELIHRRTKPWGKFVLRRAAEGFLPQSVVWRPKTDLQFGSGMCRLESELARQMMSATDAEKLEMAGKRFWNDAHAALFLIYRRMGLQINPPGEGQYACAGCGAGVDIGRRHCVTCGASPSDVA